MDPQSGIQYLKGVGPARAKQYARKDIHTLRDLLYHFPRDYVDLRAPIPCAQAARYGGEAAAVRGIITAKSPEARVRGNLSLFKALAEDDSGALQLTFFNAKYTADALRIGGEYLFYGMIKPGQPPEMTAPQVFDVRDAPPLFPIYPLTAGLTSKGIARDMRQALAAAPDMADPLPAAVLRAHQLLPLADALSKIHFPASEDDAAAARRRLIFEELFILALALRQSRAGYCARTQVVVSPPDWDAFFSALPFPPTGAQRRAAAEIAEDMGRGVPMSRLLQGDVGSGKTLVAAAACYAAVRSGYQCAVMAPTEILAEQHQQTFARLLEPYGVRTVLLTGSTRGKQRRRALEDVLLGAAQVVAGTHALLTPDVAFHRLGLIVTDEQHRFGVAQRAALQGKGNNPHVLVMSATPIPRTLSLIIYGDLDLSVLDEMPAGRREIKTYCISSAKLPRAYAFIRGQLDEGRQAYIVCPRVEEDDASGLRAAQKVAQDLKDGEFSGYAVEILHGKLKAAQKEIVMRRFRAGEIQLLICTTVIEVGIDVPNATVMMCLDAERFGLSQLHQLRGRVGRGRFASHCILVSDARGETTRERLRSMCVTSDGFEIARTDLRLRGPGDFFGGRQHGLPGMAIAATSTDVSVLSDAQEAARRLLETDPLLETIEHRALRGACERLLHSVGQRPN